VGRSAHADRETTMNRILLAVDDSPAGLAAARTAIRLASDTGAQLRVVHVLPDGALARALEGSSDVDSRQAQGAAAVLRYVDDLARAAGVAAETRTLQGKPARTILGEAGAWKADLVVIGRAGGRHVGEHYVGSAVQRVLEFADMPVLVVPA
jgi:nucleotide-binding universal stress UspA family protein